MDVFSDAYALPASDDRLAAQKVPLFKGWRLVLFWLKLLSTNLDKDAALTGPQTFLKEVVIILN